MNDSWIAVCKTDEIERGDVIRFDHNQQTYALYRTIEDKYYATEGLCTHGKVHLAGGLVMDHIIECPKHNGRFDFTTGQAKGLPACVSLKTYPVRLEDGKVFLGIGAQSKTAA